MGDPYINSNSNCEEIFREIICRQKALPEYLLEFRIFAAP